MEEKERKNEIKSEPKGYFNEERIYCIQQEDGTYETTEFPPNFDADGYYWKKQEDGQYVSTGLKYNEYGFRADRKHAVTKSYVDVRGFNIKGENIPNKGRMHDKKGFKQDGTYWRTGEKYHNGYNAYDVDIEGKKRNGQVRGEILFAQEYIQGIIEGKKDEVIKNNQVDYYDVEGLITKIPVIMYKAFEMYPKLKMEIVGKIREMEKEIRNKEQTIEEIKAIGASKKMQVARLLSERRIQKQKVKELRDLFDLDK